MHRSSLFLALLILCPALSVAQQTTGIYVANQGNFSDKNGSITYYDPVTGEASEVLSDFGTLVQSVALVGGSVYVMSNTSGNVDILDLATHERIGQIPGVASPRYMAVAPGSKAYVSNLYSNTVTTLDLGARTILGAIDVGSNPEDIAVTRGRAYVANSGFGNDSTLTVIDILTDTVVDSIDLGCLGPRHLEIDEEHDIWVFCKGATIYNDDFTEVIARINGAVVVLNGATGEIMQRFDFEFQPGAASLGQDSWYSAGSQEAFLLHGRELLVFSTTTNAMQETITLSGEDDVGGIAYDAQTQQFYAARLAPGVMGFTTPGYVSIHDRDGIETMRFAAGIAPSSIALRQERTPTLAEGAELPQEFGLQANYPNPFHDATQISWKLAEPGFATLVIFDALGRVAAIPVRQHLGAGHHEHVWSAGALPNGVYFAQLTSGQHVSTRRLLLAR